MARFVIGNTKISGIPAIVRDMSPAHYIEKTVDANGKLNNSTSLINLSGITDIGEYCLANAYYGVVFPANTQIDLSSLTTISGAYACNFMFSHTQNITSVNLSNLTTISGIGACQNMFSLSNNLTTFVFDSLTTISGMYVCDNMFKQCYNLISVDFPELTTISGNYEVFNNSFSQCTSLLTAKFNKLNVINPNLSASYSQIFPLCYKLERVEFGGLTASTFASKKTQLQGLFNNTTGRDAPNGCTVHFPSNFDPSDPNHTFDASTLTGYPTFGGSASYIHVAFDLPATE